MEQTTPRHADLLDDPSVVTLTVPQAAALLGVAKTTAHNAIAATGELIPGVPALRIGRRCVVSAAHLRTALGRPEPVRSA